MRANCKCLLLSNHTHTTLSAWEGYDEEDTGTSSKTNAFSITGKVNTITAEVVAKYLGLDRSEMTPQKCTS